MISSIIRLFQPNHSRIISKIKGNIAQLESLNARKIAEAEKLQRKQAKIENKKEDALTEGTKAVTTANSLKGIIQG